jgi:hypothetical protein
MGNQPYAEKYDIESIPLMSNAKFDQTAAAGTISSPGPPFIIAAVRDDLRGFVSTQIYAGFASRISDRRSDIPIPGYGSVKTEIERKTARKGIKPAR